MGRKVGGVFYSPRIRSQSVSEPMPLGCKCHNASHFFPQFDVGQNDWKSLKLDISLPLSWVDFDKTPID